MGMNVEYGFHGPYGSETLIDFHNYGNQGDLLSAAMSRLSATIARQGSHRTYKSSASPHFVLDTLERQAGYRVVTANTAEFRNQHGQLYNWQIWTLHKAD